LIPPYFGEGKETANVFASHDIDHIEILAAAGMLFANLS
jgi:hypothetical protein